MPLPRHELRRAVGASLIASTLLAGASVSAAETVAFFVEDELDLYRQEVRPAEPIEEPTFLNSLRVRTGLPYRVTPDARTIVYADDPNSTIDIYSRPSDGSGEPTLLSSDQGAQAYLPDCANVVSPDNVFSPDGARVFFLQYVGGRIQAFVAAVDGSGDPVLVSSANPSGDAASPFYDATICPSFFTPDGSRVLFVESDGVHIRLYSRASDGSGEPILLSNEGGFFGDVYRDVAMSPDGTRVAYRIQESALARLYSRAIDGSGTPRLLSDEAPGEGTTVKRGPLYGPNSEYVVFIEESGGVDQLFSRRDADGWEPQRLSDPAENAVVTDYGSPISESHEAVVFTAGGQLYQQALDADEGDPRVQLSRGDPWRVLGRGAPLSPDGEIAVYLADENLEDDQVFSVAVAGDEDPVLLSDADRDADLLGWNDISPDSVTAVFQQEYGGGTRQLFVRPLDGSWEAPRLVSNADPQPFGAGDQEGLGKDLVWSPDSQYLAFTECDYAAGNPENCLDINFRGPWFEAWIATADGEGPSLLSSDPAESDASYPLLVPEPTLRWATLAALASVLAIHRTRRR